MTKYINTMTPEEIEAWSRAPGAGAAAPTVLAEQEAKASVQAARATRKAAPKPPRRCFDCGALVSQRALRCPDCSLKARTTGVRPIVLLVVPSSHIPETAKDALPPCRFCGEPSTTEDRCARHDALWRRLKGLPAADLEALAGDA